MSLTDEFDIDEMFRKPVKEKHHPNFHGDISSCYRKTGHCSNTDACNDCRVYQSMNTVRDYQDNMKDL